MKRRMRLWIIVFLIPVLLTGCAKKTENTAVPDEGLYISATFFPFYALTRMITDGVDRLNLQCLVQPQDGCLRSYEISDWDAAVLSSADIIICGGCGLESFDSYLRGLAQSTQAKLYSVMNQDSLIEVKCINDDPDRQTHWRDPLPFAYMSTDGALEIAEQLALCLTEADPENTELYEKNLEIVRKKIRNVQKEIQKIASGISGGTVIVMNESLTYTAAELGLEIEACYDRDSGEGLYDHELTVCLEYLSECRSNVLLIEQQAPSQLVQALREAGYTVVLLNTMSTARASDGAETYFNILRSNAEAVLDQLEKNNG